MRQERTALDIVLRRAPGDPAAIIHEVEQTLAGKVWGCTRPREVSLERAHRADLRKTAKSEPAQRRAAKARAAKKKAR